MKNSQATMFCKYDAHDDCPAGRTFLSCPCDCHLVARVSARGARVPA